MSAPLHSVESDGITVWVNGAGGLLGRFGKAGIDIHRSSQDQLDKGECLFCTHAFVTEKDWPLFKEKMLEHFSIKVSDRYKSKRFR
jgi:hypothetical protein